MKEQKVQQAKMISVSLLTTYSKTAPYNFLLAREMNSNVQKLYHTSKCSKALYSSKSGFIIYIIKRK